MLHNILFKMVLKKKLVFVCFNLILFTSILKLSEISIATASVDVEVTASAAEFGDEYVYGYIVKNIGEGDADESIYKLEFRHKDAKPTDHIEPINWTYNAGDGVISWYTYGRLAPGETLTFTYFTSAPFNNVLWRALARTGNFDFGEIDIFNIWTPPISVDVEVTASVAKFGEENLCRYVVKNIGKGDAAESVYGFEVRHKDVKPTDHVEPYNWSYKVDNGVISWYTYPTWSERLDPGETLTFTYSTSAPFNNVLWRVLAPTGNFDFGLIYIGDDTTPPSTPKVKDEGERISWESSDPESGIVEYQYAIGTTKGGMDVVGWTSVGTNTSATKDKLKLEAGIYYFSVKAKNGAGIWSSPWISDGIAIGPTTQGTAILNLQQGLNIVSLPLKPDTPYNARTFAEKLGATIVIEYDKDIRSFSAFLPKAATTDGFTIRGGMGYIVNLTEDIKVSFTGSAWTGELLSPQRSMAQDGAWAFVVGGKVSSPDIARVQAVNLRTGIESESLTGKFGQNTYAIGFVDMPRREIVSAGDELQIVGYDKSGNRLTEPSLKWNKSRSILFRSLKRNCEQNLV